MLTQLYIENLAVIEQVSLEFSTGLHVLTGETGAGKSMIIDAIHSILGERMRRDSIRNGAEKAFVSAMFDRIPDSACAALEEAGYALEEDGTLLVQRTLTADGKSICRINGRPATLSVLKEITPQLLNIHGQHESYQLLSPNLHIHYIDQMDGLDGLLADYQEAYKEMRAIRAKMKALQIDEAEKEDRMGYLRYRIEELEKAEIRPGEREDLTAQRNRYANSGRIAQSLHLARELLAGGDETDGIVGMLGNAEHALQDAQTYLPALTPLAEKLREMTYEAEDIQETLRDFAGEIEFDPAQLEAIEQRLDLLYRLSLKYGETEEAMLQTLSQMQEELDNMESAGELLSQLTAEYEAAKAKAIALARELSHDRTVAAREFTAQVREQLHFLNMPGIQFTVSQERVPLHALGCDQMEFLIAANPGEAPKPLAKIASGGELSRIMLAIKTVLSGGDGIDTLIFDEVDTGISGGTAEKVGLKLKAVSKNRQVLCVTHLAQIAALGDHHYKIRKEVMGERTYTKVELLDQEGRCQELARIMGGSEITPLMLKNAAELLERGKTL